MTVGLRACGLVLFFGGVPILIIYFVSFHSLVPSYDLVVLDVSTFLVKVRVACIASRENVFFSIRSEVSVGEYDM